MSPHMSSSPSALKRKRENEYDNTLNETSSPSREILNLISHYVDSETLAVASCVSITWSQCFSLEHLWKSKLIKHYPSLFHISMTTNPGLSYKRLFSVFAEPDSKHSCKNQSAKPKISLSDLMFILRVSKRSKIATVVKHGKDLTFGANERLEIEFDLTSNNVVAFTKNMKKVKLKWQVVYKNFEKVLTMTEIVRSLDTRYGWFLYKQFPVLETCFSRSGGVVGYIIPRFNDDNVLDKISVSIENPSNLRRLKYSMFNDALKYLQCFFL